MSRSIDQRAQAKQSVYVIERGGATLSIPVRVGSYFQYPNYLLEVLPVQVLSLIITLLGLVLLFFSPASEVRGRLVGIAWVLAGVALTATGPGYWSCAWFAPNVAMLSFTAAIFFATAAHLYFPVPSFSSRTRSLLIYGAFAVSVLLGIAYIVEQVLWKSPTKIQPLPPCSG